MTDLYINRGRFGNHPTDVVGYTFDADCYCPDCTAKHYADEWTSEGWISESATDSEGNSVHPIFANSEWDSPAHCADCSVMLDGISLTPDGYAYVEDQIHDYIAAGLRSPIVRAGMGSAVIAEWREEWGDYLFHDAIRDDILEVFDGLANA